MNFFDFFDNISDDSFIYYDGRKFNVVFEKHDIDGVNTLNLTDIIPFVIDFPKSFTRARFSGRYNSYVENYRFYTCYRDQHETIEDFMPRAEKWLSR